jgi:hypothetical protein
MTWSGFGLEGRRCVVWIEPNRSQSNGLRPSDISFQVIAHYPGFSCSSVEPLFENGGIGFVETSFLAKTDRFEIGE